MRSLTTAHLGFEVGSEVGIRLKCRQDLRRSASPQAETQAAQGLPRYALSCSVSHSSAQITCSEVPVPIVCGAQEPSGPTNLREDH